MKMNVDASGRMKCECDAKVERRQVEEGKKRQGRHWPSGIRRRRGKGDRGFVVVMVMKMKMMVVNESCRGKNTMW